MSIQTGAPQAAIEMQSPPTANEVSSHLVSSAEREAPLGHSSLPSQQLRIGLKSLWRTSGLYEITVTQATVSAVLEKRLVTSSRGNRCQTQAVEDITLRGDT